MLSNEDKIVGTNAHFEGIELIRQISTNWNGVCRSGKIKVVCPEKLKSNFDIFLIISLS